MKTGPFYVTAALALALGMAACGNNASAPAGDAAQSAAGPGNDWDSLTTLPKFTGGIWTPVRDANFGERKFPEGVPPNPYTFLSPVPKMTAAGQPIFDNVKHLSETGGDVPSRNRQCISGFGGSMSGPESQFEFAYSPGRVIILQSGGKYRRIYTDGSKLQDDPDLTLQGYSVGHWEGDTLVVETNGIDPKVEFLYGIPYGDNAKATERMRLSEPNTLEIVSTVEGSNLAEPYTRTNTYHREEKQLAQSDCIPNGNNDANGNQTFNLTPPP